MGRTEPFMQNLSQDSYVPYNESDFSVFTAKTLQ